jgi:hypothetical protein
MFRIVKYEEGYVVETQKKTWYGRKHWVTFITATGSNTPWHYKSFYSAMLGLVREIKWVVIKQSPDDIGDNKKV